MSEGLNLKPSRDLKAINELLNQFRHPDSQVHLVGPGVRSLVRLESLPDSFEIAWHVFRFNPQVGGPHVYHDNSWDKGVVALKREALLNLWVSADGSSVHSERSDGGGDPYYVRYSWAGSVRSLSGATLSQVCTREIDLREGSPGALALKEKPAMLRRQRGDINQICESKAQNRVIRSLLGISQGYTEETVKWSFILMKLVFVPDLSDPMTRLLVTAQALGASAALFGGAGGAEVMRQLLTAKTIENVPAPGLSAGSALGQLGPGLSAIDPEEEGYPEDEVPAFTVESETIRETAPARPLFADPPPALAADVAAKKEQAKPQDRGYSGEKPRIDTIDDYERLEGAIASGVAFSDKVMVDALNDLQARNPNKKNLKISKPVHEWPVTIRRQFVTKMLEK